VVNPNEDDGERLADSAGINTRRQFMAGSAGALGGLALGGAFVGSGAAQMDDEEDGGNGEDGGEPVEEPVENEFEDDVERRTVDKPAVESELKRYVRARMRRGHARGWGPYLVLLYGTVLILGAFSFLNGLYVIAAMLILGLSTLGLYTLFIIVGMGLNLLETPGKAVDYARSRGDDD
jgi:hypothetical protein